MKTLPERTAAALAWIDSQLAICNAATDGPWKDSENYLIGGWWVQDNVAKEHEGSIADCCRKEDAAFIAAARTVCPALLEGMKVAIEGFREITTVEGPMRVWAKDSLESILTKIEQQ